jgi:hypothetical protein
VKKEMMEPEQEGLSLGERLSMLEEIAKFILVLHSAEWKSWQQIKAINEEHKARGFNTRTT